MADTGIFCVIMQNRITSYNVCYTKLLRLDVNAEEALAKSSDKFISRFEKIENYLELNGIDMKSLSIDELDVYWQKLKDVT